MGRRKRKKNTKIQLLTAVIVIILGVLSSFLDEGFISENFLTVREDTEGLLNIYYLDVGQGDATYINIGNFDILIDAGSKSEKEKLIQQLEELNIDDFEMVIATHPHEDHIGGMEAVFERYNVKEFYMPKIIHTSKVFESMITAVANEGIKVKIIKDGTTFNLGNGAQIDVYSPIYESYSNLNDYSPIMKLTFGENSFIFTGDAEAPVELEVVEKYGSDLEADVLKFGHHGSSTSSTEEFIQAVDPKYGVISSGANNMYGHPHREVLSLISEYDIETYRTDIDGQVVFISDGKIITVQN